MGEVKTVDLKALYYAAERAGLVKTCPTCVTEGQRSIVHAGMSTTTLMNVSWYYDTAGNWHFHDPNRTTTPYTCSNGHRWTETSRTPCPQPNCCL